MKEKIKVAIVNVLSYILKFVVGSHIIMFLTEDRGVAQKLHGKRGEIEKMLELSAAHLINQRMKEFSEFFTNYKKKNAKIFN